MVFDVSLGVRIKSSCERMLSKAELDIPVFLSKENWRALSGVARGACQDALRLAMLEIRFNNDIASAKEKLSRAKSAGLVLAGIPEGAVSASRFDLPIYCCLLAHDVSGAERLANVALLGKVTSGNHFDVHAKILSAFVLDDIRLLEEQIRVFDGMAKLYWWRAQRVYFDLYRAVLQKDERLYNQLLNKAISSFGSRATDKDFGDQLGEYGGLEYNQFAIDFMALGIAILAQSKGLEFTGTSNDYFPTALVAL